MLYWFSIGIALILAEMFVPTFIFLFFGLAAILASLVSLFGLGIEWQLVSFIVSTPLLLFFGRSKIKNIFVGKKEIVNEDDEDGNALSALFSLPIKVDKEIAANGEGTVIVGDSYWRATSNSHIEAGKMVKIIKQDNHDKLLLIVKEIEEDDNNIK